MNKRRIIHLLSNLYSRKIIPLIRSIVIVLGLLAAAVSCNQSGEPGTSNSNNIDSVRVDHHFTAMFNMQGENFTGGDGTYSTLLPDGRTAWLFGDTFIGGKNPDNTRTRKDPMYIRNSLVVQDGDELSTYINTIGGRDASLVVHPDAMPVGEQKLFTEDSVWFWPGDVYVENGKMKIFLSEFVQADTGMWGFDWQGTWIAEFALPGFEKLDCYYLEKLDRTDVHLGHAVMKDETHTYVYGAGGGKPHVARYEDGNIKGDWEFFDGGSWSHDINSLQPMAEFEGSEQFSVFREGDLYIMIMQMGGLSDEICSFISETPYGPWENRQLLFKTPIPDTNRNLFTYNAVAHPQFTENGSLLISYNMNSMVLQDHFDNAGIYRPRFIRVPLQQIIAKSDEK